MNHKPGSVLTAICLEEPLSALSRQSTRGLPTGHWPEGSPSIPHAWLCSWWGLPFRLRCRLRGGPLPRLFTLTWPLNATG